MNAVVAFEECVAGLEGGGVRHNAFEACKNARISAASTSPPARLEAEFGLAVEGVERTLLVAPRSQTIQDDA